MNLDYKFKFLKERKCKLRRQYVFLVQVIGSILIAVSFSITNGTIASLRILETSEKAYQIIK